MNRCTTTITQKIDFTKNKTKEQKSQQANKLPGSISLDRKRTNILKGLEQETLQFLCRIMPAWASPDMLTAVGLLGGFIVFAGFWMAQYNVYYMSLAIFGWAVNWFGDSLDGRIAYYRNIPRKWYGFSLDLSMDWVTTIVVALGLYFYLPTSYKPLAFTYLGTYGWSMILALLKYKLTNQYVIDTGGLVGPTELRIAICLVLLLEMLFPNSIKIFAVVVNVIMMIVNMLSFMEILKIGNSEDNKAKE